MPSIGARRTLNGLQRGSTPHQIFPWPSKELHRARKLQPANFIVGNVAHAPRLGRYQLRATLPQPSHSLATGSTPRPHRANRPARRVSGSAAWASASTSRTLTTGITPRPRRTDQLRPLPGWRSVRPSTCALVWLRSAGVARAARPVASERPLRASQFSYRVLAARVAPGSPRPVRSAPRGQARPRASRRAPSLGTRAPGGPPSLKVSLRPGAVSV